MLPYLDNNQKLPMYGIMMLLGIAVCFLLLIFLNTNSRVKREDRIYAGCFAIAGGILGAKLLAILTSIKYIIEYDISLTDIIKNGFVFYGGLIGGALGIILYARMYKMNVLDFFDFAAVFLPLGQFFGRLGCFLAGCCFGHPTDSFLGVTYHISADPNTPLGIPILPTQLFESAYCLVIFAALLIISRKERPRGMLVTIYILSYSVCRFINEFFRFDAARGFLWGLSTSQIISLLLIVIVDFFYIKKLISGKQAKANSETK